MDKKELIALAMKAAEMSEPTRIKLSVLSPKVQKAYHVLREHPGINAHQLEDLMSVSEATSKRYIGELVKMKLLERIGSRKTGGYYITEEDKEKFLYAHKCKNCLIYKVNKNTHNSWKSKNP